MSPTSSAIVMGQNLADAADGLERLVVVAQLESGHYAAFELLNLVVDAIHYCQVRLQGLLLVIEQLHGVDALGIPSLDIVAADARADVASHQVLRAEDLAAALAHELAALAQQVAHGAPLHHVAAAQREHAVNGAGIEEAGDQRGGAAVCHAGRQDRGQTVAISTPPSRRMLFDSRGEYPLQCRIVTGFRPRAAVVQARRRHLGPQSHCCVEAQYREASVAEGDAAVQQGKRAFACLLPRLHVAFRTGRDAHPALARADDLSGHSSPSGSRLRLGCPADLRAPARHPRSQAARRRRRLSSVRVTAVPVRRRPGDCRLDARRQPRIPSATYRARRGTG